MSKFFKNYKKISISYTIALHNSLKKHYNYKMDKSEKETALTLVRSL